jgi:hypothetical protein
MGRLAAQEVKRQYMEIIDAAPFALRATTPEKNWIHRLSKGRTIVGRSKMADVEIEEIFAARSYCALDWDDNLKCHLLSVWGPNGVSVNGAFLPVGTERRPLSAEDELRIGGVSLRYEGVSETPDIAG